MSRKPIPWTPELLAPWQIEQGRQCACRGQDDMCRCQNEPKPWISEADRLNARLREIEAVLVWMEERGRNSQSFGSHADAYEIAARRLSKALET